MIYYPSRRRPLPRFGTARHPSACYCDVATPNGRTIPHDRQGIAGKGLVAIALFLIAALFVCAVAWVAS